MKQLLLILSCPLIFLCHVNAQITGSVTDSLNQPLPFSNVMMLRAADSTVVTGTTCSDIGTFQLEKKESGDFRLMVMYSGFEKTYTDVFTLSADQSTYVFGTIVLHQNKNQLGEVAIVSQKPFMEQKLDRTVFNIENSVLSSGNNALDVLRKLPGVTVDNSDNISVRGKQGVEFMIDGRKSYMSGQDMANYLRGIDASQLERIEVITNPSAKYDAAGNAIINIVMKKNKNLGYNQQVSADYGQGVYASGNIGTNLNYKTKKWNFFGGANYGQWKFYEEIDRKVQYNADSVYHSSNIGAIRRVIDGNWNSESAGIDYSPGDRHTIGVVYEHSNGSRDQERSMDSYLYNSAGSLDSNLFTIGPEINNHVYNSGDVNYKFDIDTTGRLLTADFNYATFSIRSVRENATSYYDGNHSEMHPTTAQLSDLFLQVHISAGQVDYVNPFKNGLLFETGVKSSYVVTTSNAQYANRLNGITTNDTAQSNDFLYTETISAAYVNFSKKLNDKLDGQFGLRAEQTDSKADQRTSGVIVTRSYLQLFPSAFLNWMLDSTNSLNISYTRRVDRPDYGDLNPFVFHTDPYMTFSGNPYLKPQMSDRYEVAHIFKGVYRTAISYMHMTQVFNMISSLDDSTLIMNTRWENLSTYNVVTLEFSASVPVKNWYTVSGSAYVFRDHYFGPVNGTDFSVTNWTWLVFVQNSFSLKKSWSLEANFFYRSLNMDGVWRQKPFSGLDVGAKKKFSDGRGTVALSVTDIFKKTYLSSTASYGNVNISNSGQNDSRRLQLSVSWKLGRSEYEREQRRQSAEDAKGRAQ